jgi:hypothetical protein
MWESLMTLMGVPLVLCGSPMACVGVPYDPHGSPLESLWESLWYYVGVP